MATSSQDPLDPLMDANELLGAYGRSGQRATSTSQRLRVLLLYVARALVIKGGFVDLSAWFWLLLNTWGRRSQQHEKVFSYRLYQRGITGSDVASYMCELINISQTVATR